MKKSYEELSAEGFKITQSDYIETKKGFEDIKNYWESKTDAIYKVYRAKSDTKGLLAYEVYKKEFEK